MSTQSYNTGNTIYDNNGGGSLVPTLGKIN